MKRKPRVEDDCAWDCSVCTFTNGKDAFACQMCDTRKGTSTRKPRINNQVVELQQQIQKAILKEKTEDGKRKSTQPAKRDELNDEMKSNKFPKLKDIDRNKPDRFEITSRGITVTITEFKMKRRSKVLSMSSKQNSSCYETPVSQSTNESGLNYDGTSPISPSVSSCSSSFHANLTSTPFHNDLSSNISITQVTSLPQDSFIESLSDQCDSGSKKSGETADLSSHTRSTLDMSDPAGTSKDKTQTTTDNAH